MVAHVWHCVQSEVRCFDESTIVEVLLADGVIVSQQQRSYAVRAPGLAVLLSPEQPPGKSRRLPTRCSRGSRNTNTTLRSSPKQPNRKSFVDDRSLRVRRLKNSDVPDYITWSLFMSIEGELNVRLLRTMCVELDRSCLLYPKSDSPAHIGHSYSRLLSVEASILSSR